MRFSAAILLFFAHLGTAFVAAPVVAQDVAPETPPELRDFRLDQPREQAPPQPAPQQTVPQEPAVTPPVTRTPPDAKRQPPSPVRQQQQATQQSPDTESPRSDVPQEVAPAIEPEVTTEPSVAAQPIPDQALIVPPATENATVWNWPLIAGILLALSALGLFIYVLRRRRRAKWQLVEADGTGEVAASNSSQSIPAFPPAKLQQEPARPSADATAPGPAPKSATTGGDVSILFVPEKATISFTNLTVQGQLQIVNDGESPAQNMQLRAVLVSASSEQQRAIDSFFADPAQIAPNALGEAKPGERIGLSLELSVPLSEMQTFPVGDQRLLVPILVASLSYADESGVTTDAHLACMIGREAQPPKPKMGPLRTDKGPRSFAPLGQRPVYT